MSELVFVRHGQASFGADSYDKLSDKGVEQVRILAQHWLEIGEQFDYLYHGTLLRQKETAKELLPLIHSHPSRVIEHSYLNEYNGDPLLRAYLENHAKADGFNVFIDWPIKDEKLFQELLERATSLWVKGELQPRLNDNEFETWEDFQFRVYDVIDEIIASHSSGSRVLVSTSGGVIAMALQRVLQFPDEKVISTNWMVHNSSVTRFKYGNGKVSLTQFNSLPHLERNEFKHMITYR